MPRGERVNLSMIAGAAIFSPLAFATSAHVQLEANVPRLSFGRLLELHDEVVAVAFGEFRLADERVALFLELERGLAALGVGDDGHGLRGDGNWLHVVVVEVDGHGAVFLGEEFGVWLGFFEELPALGRDLVFVFVGGVGGE